ncbi:MAG: hypothetical protein AAF514_18200 [Verrucomicrobiota bacterium]
METSSPQPPDLPPAPPSPPQPEPRNLGKHRTGLILFGILTILIGLLMLLGAIGNVVQLGIAGGMMEFRMISLTILGVCLNLVYTVAAIWIGVGLIMARRWARSLMVALSGVTFGMMTVMTVLFGVLLILLSGRIPQILNYLDQMGGGPGPEERGVFVAILCVVALFMFFIYVILPGIVFLYHRKENVRLACEFVDRKIRWTDRVPLTVLGLGIMMFFASVSALSLAGYQRFPLFGMWLTGIPAIVLSVVLSLAYVVSAVLCLRVKMAGLLLSMALTGLFLLTLLITLAPATVKDLFQGGADYMALAMGEPSAGQLPPEIEEIMPTFSFLNGKLLCLIMGVPLLGYLLYQVMLLPAFRRGPLQPEEPLPPLVKE